MSRARAVVACGLALAPLGCAMVLSIGDVPADLGSGADGGADAPTPDAPSDSPAPLDGDALAADAGARCAWTAPFTRVAPIAELNTSDDDFRPRLTRNELVLYLARGRSRGTDLLRFTRGSRAAAFQGPGDPVVGVNTSAYAETDPFIEEGETSIFFASDRNHDEAGTRYDIFHGTISDAGSVFDTFDSIPLVDTIGNDEYAPYVTPNGNLYFTRSIGAAGGDKHNYVAIRQGAGYLDPVAVPGITAATSNEVGPVVSDDELTIYYASDSDVGTQIFVAHRSAVGQDFTAAHRVDELFSTDDPQIHTEPAWLSSDQCRLYYFSNVAGDAAADYNVYVAERKP